MLNNKYSASLGKLTGPMASGLLKMHGQERGRGLSSSCFSRVSFCMTTVGLTSVKPNLKMQNHKCSTICGPYCALFGPLDYKVIACLSDKRCSTCTCSLSLSLSIIAARLASGTKNTNSRHLCHRFQETLCDRAACTGCTLHWRFCHHTYHHASTHVIGDPAGFPLAL